MSSPIKKSEFVSRALEVINNRWLWDAVIAIEARNLRVVCYDDEMSARLAGHSATLLPQRRCAEGEWWYDLQVVVDGVTLLSRMHMKATQEAEPPQPPSRTITLGEQTATT